MVWLERFVLALFVLAFWNWVMNNGMHIDRHFRIALAFILIGASYGVGHAVYLGARKSATPHANEGTPPVESPSKASPASGAASSTGDQSPAITGNGNTVSYGTPPDAHKKDTK